MEADAGDVMTQYVSVAPEADRVRKFRQNKLKQENMTTIQDQLYQLLTDN